MQTSFLAVRKIEDEVMMNNVFVHFKCPALRPHKSERKQFIMTYSLLFRITVNNYDRI